MATLAETRQTYRQAAVAFLALAARIPDERYAEPGLGSWDLRSLVGHTSRSFVTVSDYLQTRADAVAVETPAAYYAAVRRLVGRDDDGSVAARGVAAGAALGDDPVATLLTQHQAAQAALDALGDRDPVVETLVGGMRVSDYLPTRTFELTVHCLDIDRATGLGFDPTDDVLAEVLAVASDSARALDLGVPVLLALTGREPLPEGCSVVP